MALSPENNPERINRLPLKPVKIIGYDNILHMYIEAPRQPNLKRLIFLRWLAERDLLEHPVAGPASGELVIQFQELLNQIKK